MSILKATEETFEAPRKESTGSDTIDFQLIKKVRTVLYQFAYRIYITIEKNQPKSAQAKITLTILILNLNSAAKATMPINNDTQSKLPSNPVDQST